MLKLLLVSDFIFSYPHDRQGKEKRMYKFNGTFCLFDVSYKANECITDFVKIITQCLKSYHTFLLAVKITFIWWDWKGKPTLFLAVGKAQCFNSTKFS